MDRLNHVNIKQEDDDGMKEVAINNEEKQPDNEGSSSQHDNTSQSNIHIKQEFDDDEQEEVLMNNAVQQENTEGSSSRHDNTSSSNVYIKQEFDDVEHKEVLINNTQQHSVQRCTKVKKDEKAGEIKLELDPIDDDKCDCLECRVEREIKIEFNQTKETEQVNRSLGPSEANKDASQQCKCVKKKKDEEDDCEYIGLWDKDCGCKRCTKNRNISIELNQTNATENQQVNSCPLQSEAEEDASRKHTIQVNKRVEKEEGAQDRGDGDGGARGEDDGIDSEDVEVRDGNNINSEDGDELDEEGDECQLSDESEDDETEIDDEEYEMEVDGGESSDEETEVDEQFDLETESTSLKFKMVQKTAQIEIVRIGKLYRCTFEGCDKQFKAYRDIRRHICTHAFKCTWMGCNKTYSTQEKVRKHYMQHTGEKESFKCTWKDCDKAFVEKSNMKKHLRIHTGEKAFKCLWDAVTRHLLEKIA